MAGGGSLVVRRLVRRTLCCSTLLQCYSGRSWRRSPETKTRRCLTASCSISSCIVRGWLSAFCRGFSDEAAGLAWLAWLQAIRAPPAATPAATSLDAARMCVWGARPGPAGRGGFGLRAVKEGDALVAARWFDTEFEKVRFSSLRKNRVKKCGEKQKVSATAPGS